MSFGSPVSDFLPSSHAALRLKHRETAPASGEALPATPSNADDNAEAASDDESDVENEKGVLDLLADIQAAGEAIGPIGEKIGKDTEAIATRTLKLTPRASRKLLVPALGQSPPLRLSLVPSHPIWKVTLRP